MTGGVTACCAADGVTERAASDPGSAQQRCAPQCARDDGDARYQRGDGGRPSIRPNGNPWIIFHQFFSCLILRGSPDMERRCRDRSSTIRIAARKLVDPRYGGEPSFAGRRARAFSWLNVWRVKPSGGHDYGRARRSDKTPPARGAKPPLLLLTWKFCVSRNLSALIHSLSSERR